MNKENNLFCFRLRVCFWSRFRDPAALFRVSLLFSRYTQAECIACLQTSRWFAIGSRAAPQARTVDLMNSRFRQQLHSYQLCNECSCRSLWEHCLEGPNQAVYSGFPTYVTCVLLPWTELVGWSTGELLALCARKDSGWWMWCIPARNKVTPSLRDDPFAHGSSFDGHVRSCVSWCRWRRRWTNNWLIDQYYTDKAYVS